MDLKANTMAKFPGYLKNNFERDGFVHMAGFLNNDEVGVVREKLTNFIHTQVPSLPASFVYFDDKSDPNSLKQIQRIFDFSPFFKKMMFEGRFKEFATFLLGNQVIPKNLQYFNKPPQTSKATPPHQDGYYFMLDPNEAVTMWLAMEDVDEENGCVRYIKGSHQLGMRSHTQSNVLGFSQGISDFGTESDHLNEVSIAVKAGDLLVHHSLTIHRAGANQSADRNRRALGFVYYSMEAKEDKKALDRYAQALTARLMLENKI